VDSTRGNGHACAGIPEQLAAAGHHEPGRDSPVSEESLVLFEVLSKSNTKVDQVWRRKVYTSVPNCQHYVTVSAKSFELVVYDRSTEWAARKVINVADTLDLPAIAVSMPLAEIYRWTPLAPVAS
jgi:hypothetical protein